MAGISQKEYNDSIRREVLHMKDKFGKRILILGAVATVIVGIIACVLLVFLKKD